MVSHFPRSVTLFAANHFQTAATFGLSRIYSIARITMVPTKTNWIPCPVSKH